MGELKEDGLWWKYYEEVNSITISRKDPPEEGFNREEALQVGKQLIDEEFTALEKVAFREYVHRRVKIGEDEFYVELSRNRFVRLPILEEGGQRGKTNNQTEIYNFMDYSGSF